MKKLVAILGIFVFLSGCITINIDVPGSQDKVVNSNEISDSQNQNQNSKADAPSFPTSQDEELKDEELNVKNNNALKYYEKGGDYMDNKDYQNAKYYFQKSIELNPDYYNATLGLSLAELQLGDYYNAEKHALKAIELNYTCYYSYIILATIQAKQGDYQKAYSSLSVAYKYAPNEEKGKIYDMQTAIATKIQ